MYCKTTNGILDVSASTEYLWTIFGANINHFVFKLQLCKWYILSLSSMYIHKGNKY